MAMVIRKVAIDPGHAGGNVDPGACNAQTGLQEADVALAVSKKLADFLSQAGITVVMTRQDQEDEASDDLQYRCDIANRAEVDLFVSIHCNSATPGAHGTEVWTSLGETQGDAVATAIMNQISATFVDLAVRADWSDGDVDKESNFYVLKYTDAPACLVEMAFISNDEEAAWLADDEWQSKMAAAIARGITDMQQ